MRMSDPNSSSRARPGRRRVWSACLLGLLVALLAVALPVPLNGAAEGEPEVPWIGASGAIVLSDFNQIYYDLNSHVRVPMASTTKMMTAIVAVRYGDLDMEVVIDESDLVGESTMGLWAGEVVTLHDLLYGLLLPSGNDAATAIARSLGWRSDTTSSDEAVANFVDLMNETAREYGLEDTHYMNPHGLDEWGHYSTPYDLAIILRAALREPVLREVMQTPAIQRGEHDLYNGNRLLGIRGDILGGKTGFTDNAGFCLAAAAYGNNRFVIAVVVGDDGDNSFSDVSNLLDWGLEMTEYQDIPHYVDPRLIGTQFNQYPWMLNPRPTVPTQPQPSGH
jgi:D-alanyl-D-alanine carboxypeptidase (penicillin-binding protein 5/6)